MFSYVISIAVLEKNASRFKKGVKDSSAGIQGGTTVGPATRINRCFLLPDPRRFLLRPSGYGGQVAAEFRHYCASRKTTTSCLLRQKLILWIIS